MCPRTSDQWEAIRTATRKKIVQSAFRVFERKGFHASSMDLIAKQARVSKGLAYNYFASKEDLLAAVIEHWLEELETMWSSVGPAGEPLARLQELLDLFCESVTRNRGRYRLYLTVFLSLDYLEAVRRTAVRSPRLQTSLERIHTASRTLFRELGATDPDAEVAFFRMLTSGLAAEHIMSPREFPMEAMKSRILLYYKAVSALA